MNCDDVFDRLTRGPFPSGSPGDDLIEEHLSDCADCRRLATALQPALELLQEAMPPEESGELPGYRGCAASLGPDDMPRSDVEPDGRGVQSPWRPAWSTRHAASGPRPRFAEVKRPLAIPARRKSPASFVNWSTKSRSNLMRFAAAVLLGVAAAAGSRGLVTWQAAPADLSEDQPVQLAGAQSRVVGIEADGLAASAPGKPDLRHLAALDLPTACRSQNLPEPPRSVAANLAEGIQLASADLARQECCTDCHRGDNPGLLGSTGRSVLVAACSACH